MSPKVKQMQLELTPAPLDETVHTKATKLAYAAGFVDGEGYITIVQKGNSKGRPRTTPYIAVSNRDMRPLKLLQELFGGNVIPHRRKGIDGNRGDVWVWEMRGAGVKAVLRSLLPYLVSKRERAEVVVEFAGLTRPALDGKGYPPHIKERREYLFRRVRELTARYNRQSEMHQSTDVQH